MAAGLLAVLLALPYASAVMLTSPGARVATARHAGDDDDWTKNQYGEVRQAMRNYYDVQYSGIVKMGGQAVKAVIDTGSFELLVFGVNCTLCGTTPHLYDGEKSSHHSTTGFEKEHNYGSGTTYSIESYDELQIGPLKVPSQVFWEVHDANMAVLQEDSFASIFGVGPPTSAAKFAEADVEQIHGELEDLKSQGREITEETMDIVHGYEDAAKRAWQATSVVDHLGIRSMSFCMGKQSGSDGYITWNDTAPWRHADRFLKIEVAGDSYWSANMSSVKLNSLIGDKSGHVLGCEDGCSAILNSGTSLIAAPSSVVAKLEQIIEEWAAAGGTCDDLSKLPDLELSLNGNVLSLPPQSYVGRASGNYDSLAGTSTFLSKKSDSTVACTSLLMAMDTDAAEGPMWILGMPFFREYYTTFIFKEGKAHHRLQPYAMAFSRASDDCYPSAAPNPASNLQLRWEREASKLGAQLNIDISKVRVPSIVARRKIRNLLPTSKK